MIPQTLVSFFMFLVLIAPGLSYELMRERRGPAIEESAFREASRIALSSFVFSFFAFAALICIRWRYPELIFDLGSYLRDGKVYLENNYGLLIFNIALEVILAFFFVLISIYMPVIRQKVKFPKSLRPKRRPAKMSGGGIWWRLLVRDVPDGKAALVSLRLSDGSQISGFYLHYTRADDLGKQEIALQRGVVGSPPVPSPMGLRDQQLIPKRQDMADWVVIWVPCSEITYMKVKYVPLT